MKILQPLKIFVIIGTTRKGRFSERPAKWIYQVAKKRADLDVELIDLRDYPLPFYDEPKSPKLYDGKYPNPAVQKWADKIKPADGFIIVTAEYNHGYPAVLKNSLDYIYSEWNRKAVGFISYGSVSGARVIEQLRQVAVELQMAPIRESIHMSFGVMRAILHPDEAREEGDTSNPFDGFIDQADIFLNQLVWWTKALKVAREKI